MKNFKLSNVFSLVIITLYTATLTADGCLDRSFSSNGRVETSFGIDSTAKAIAVQSDGKIVIAGYTDINGQNVFAIARYENDDTIDTSFGNEGLAITKFGAHEKASGAQAVVIQADGKIIAGGFTNAVKNKFYWCLARYNSDGSLDESFFGGRGIIPGTVISTFGGADDASQIHALALQADGKILAAGYSVMGDAIVFALGRYHPDGSLDQTFNKDTHASIAGIIRTDFGSVHKKDDRAYAIAIQADGKIVVGGSSYLTGVKTFALARYLPDGALDTSFYNPGFSKVHGTVVASFAGGETHAAIKSLLVQPDGAIVAGGSTNSCHMSSQGSRFGLARFLPNGHLDTSFEGDGISLVQGTVITSFGVQEVSSQINSMVMQSDGKLIAGGFTQLANNDCCFALARYHKNGCLDLIFNNNDSAAGTVRTQFPGSIEDEIYSLALQPSGSLVAVGKTMSNIRPHIALARYVCMDNQLLAPSIQYPFQHERIVNGSTIEVRGKAQNPGIVNLFLNNSLVRSLYTKTNDWSLALPSLASGEYSLHVCHLYPAGNVNLLSDVHHFVVDQHPQVFSQQLTTSQEQPISGRLQATGASGKYHFKLLSAHNGTVSLDNDMFIFTPLDEGMGSFDFEAIDSESTCSNTAKILITIFPLPVVHNVDYTVCQDTSFKGAVSDAVTKGLPPYRFSLIDSDYSSMLTFHADGTFIFNPTPGFSGTAHFDYQVIDQRSNKSKPGRITVEVFPAPIAQNGTFSICQDITLLSSLAPLVSNGTAPYSFSLVPGSVQNGNATLDAEGGTFTFIPSTGFVGNASFKYIVTDVNKCVSKEALAIIDVLEKPIVIPSKVSTTENTILSTTLVNAVSKGKAPYTFNLIQAPHNGMLLLKSEGGFEYIPAADFSGTDQFTYAVVDACGCTSDSATVTIVVNQRPTLNSVSLALGQGTSLTTSLESYVSGGSAPYSFSLLNAPENISISSQGVLQYIPDADFYGQLLLAYQVVDSVGVASDSNVITIEIYPKPIVQNDFKELCQDTILTDTLAPLVSGGLAPYIFSLSSPVMEGADLKLNADGSYTFVPTAGFDGDVLINYRVTDAHNSTQEGIIKIHVFKKVVFNSGTFDIVQDGLLQGNLNNYIIAGQGPFIFTHLSSSHGDIELNDDGAFTFNPTSGFTGVAGFELSIQDGHHSTTNAAVVILVHPKPLTLDYTTHMCQDVGLSGSLSELVMSGTPPFVFNLIGTPLNALVHVQTDGVFHVSAATAPYASFYYNITDAYGYNSEPATVTIQVSTPPEVLSSMYSVKANSLLKGNLRESVVNADSEYQFCQVGIAPHGNVVIESDGSFVYIPHANFVGQTEFTYQVTDARGCKAIAVAIVQVISARENNNHRSPVLRKRINHRPGRPVL